MTPVVSPWYGPFRSNPLAPPPVSAWTLFGARIAYPHPLANTCCCHDGPAALGAWPGSFGGGPFPLPAGKTNPNSRMTGTGPGAFAGVVRVSWMSTVTCG